MLKSGGVIRIIVPNGHTILKSYFDDPQRIVRYRDAVTGEPMEAVNSWFYQRYEHQCIYDPSLLIGLLKGIGFSKVFQADFRKTGLGRNELLIDDEKYGWESLYVEAQK